MSHLPEYRIDMEVERVGERGDYAFALGLVVDGRQTEITIDKEIGRQMRNGPGFHGLDGIPIDLNPNAHRGQLLFPSRPARFSLTVRRGSIKLTCDGSTVVDWSGDPRRLIRSIGWQIPDRKSLFLASSSSVLFREMTLTPLPAESP